MTVFETMDKERAKELFVEGYKYGKGVETVPDISIQTAEQQFDRYWELNHE